MTPAASRLARRILIYFFEQQPQQLTPGGVGAPQHSQQFVLSFRMARSLLVGFVHLQAGLKVKPRRTLGHAHW